MSAGRTGGGAGIGPARLYTRLPAGSESALGRGARWLLPALDVRTSVVRLRGATPGSGSATLLVAGGAGPLEYLVERFFSTKPRRETIGSVFLPRLPRVLERLGADADLVVARVDRLSAGILFGRGWRAAPEWIGTRIEVPRSFDDLTRGNHSLKNDLRRWRRSGFEVRSSVADEDFVEFYRRMYVPYVRSRHGAQAVVRGPGRLYRVFRRGGLLWAFQQGSRVAGLLFRRSDAGLELSVLGVVDGRTGPIREGAVAALYERAVRLAIESGWRWVGLGGCRPSLADGTLRYKRKWGASVFEREDVHYDFLLRWKAGPCRQGFLAQVPLIVREASGLTGLVAVPAGADGAERERIRDRMGFAGLARIELVES